jgi:hypothetical protein
MFKEVRRSGRELRGALYTKAVGKTTLICTLRTSSQMGLKLWKRAHHV